MTLAEMHLEFKFGLDKLDTASLPSFEPEEIDLLLNQAVDRFIKNRYKEYEVNQKRLDDLREIVVVATPSITLDSTNIYKFTLPPDYMYRISLLADLHVISCNIDIARHRVHMVSHDQLASLLEDPFNKPSYEEGPLVVLEGNFVYLYTVNTFTITGVKLTYLQEPNALDIINFPNVPCVLSKETHREIVNEAISIALELIESPRYNTNLNELNKEE